MNLNYAFNTCYLHYKSDLRSREIYEYFIPTLVSLPVPQFPHLKMVIKIIYGIWYCLLCIIIHYYKRSFYIEKKMEKQKLVECYWHTLSMWRIASQIILCGFPFCRSSKSKDDTPQNTNLDLCKRKGLLPKKVLCNHYHSVLPPTQWGYHLFQLNISSVALQNKKLKNSSHEMILF